MILQNPRIWDLLLGAFKHGHLTVPIVFSGPAGVGKTTLVENFCRQIWAGHEVADGCDRCQQITSRAFPDLHWLSREEGASEIKVEQVQQLLQQLSSTSLLGGWQIVVVQEAQYLNENSSNALLKYLENLNPRLLFFFLVSDRRLLLPTILSRSMQFDIKPVGHDQLAQQFTWANDLSQEIRERQLVLANGCPGYLYNWQLQPEKWEEVLSNFEVINKWCLGNHQAHEKLLASLEDKSLPEQRQSFEDMARFMEISILQNSSTQFTAINKLPLIWQARTSLQAYVTPRLILDNLFYSYN